MQLVTIIIPADCFSFYYDNHAFLITNSVIKLISEQLQKRLPDALYLFSKHISKQKCLLTAGRGPNDSNWRESLRRFLWACGFIHAFDILSDVYRRRDNSADQFHYQIESPQLCTVIFTSSNWVTYFNRPKYYRKYICFVGLWNTEMIFFSFMTTLNYDYFSDENPISYTRNIHAYWCFFWSLQSQFRLANLYGHKTIIVLKIENIGCSISLVVNIKPPKPSNITYLNI